LPDPVVAVETQAKEVVVGGPSRLYPLEHSRSVQISGQMVVVEVQDGMKPAEVVDPVPVVRFI
jgi:hypothetical protein